MEKEKADEFSKASPNVPKHRIIDTIIFYIYGWKTLKEFIYKTNNGLTKSILVVQKKNQIGIVLRFGYFGNLQFHPLFDEELDKFNSAYNLATNSIQTIIENDNG